MRTALLFPFALTTALVAQSTPNLIAPTLNNSLIHQSVHATCTPLGTCATGLVPTTTWFWAGGSAWDSANTALWVTNGQQLGRYGMNGCTLQCGPILCPKSSLAAEATGMDLHDGNNQLWVIDSAGFITQCTNACPPIVQNSWNTGLPITGNWVTSAIAIDELRGLVFYSTCNFGMGQGQIYVAPLANPGAWFQSSPVFDCLPVPTLITGMAIDAANSALYWTTGRGTNRWTYTYNPAGPSVAFTPGTCCLQIAPLPDPYTDLSIRWGGATPSGGPCANGACAPCPNVHVLRNAPLLGSVLQLGLDFCQPGTLALCAVDFGPCTGAGIGIPGLCGGVLLPLTPAMLLLGPNIPVGGGPCSATTTWFLPLPSNPAFVGTVMSSQCLSFCSPTGTSMSNCLTWVLQ